MLPKMTHPLGTRIEYGDISFTVTEDLMFIKVAKQKGNLPSGKVFMCRIDYASNQIVVESRLERSGAR